eukprot:SAG31_NODE_9297_length_1302_cov_1.492103_2_plen_56_part_00
MDGHAQLVLPLLTAAQSREDVRLFPRLVDKVKMLSDALEENGGMTARSLCTSIVY